MPVYSYTARDSKGAKQRGTITAPNKQQAIQQLQLKGLTFDKLVEEEKKVFGFSLGSATTRKVKTADLLVFTRQLSTIVNAGLPLLQGLDILADQTEDPNFASIIDAIAQEVESGETFSNALRKYPKAFPDLYVSMVRAGEAGGDLDGVLMQLADYLEASEELRRRIRSAMTYPVVAFSMIILIASGLIIFVVPRFAEIFGSFGKKLPAPTQFLINLSNVLRTVYAWLIIFGSIIGIVMFLRIYGSTEIGRYNLDQIKLRLPIFGDLIRKVSISRFTKTLSTLIKSGVPILQALEIVERTSGNEVFARAVRQSSDSVRNGEALSEPLGRSGVFPPMVTRMIAVGEKTGELEAMLMKISDFYDSEVKAKVDGLTSLIEPMLIGIMGIVVGSIIVALFMPILQLSSLVQQ
ncbi:MAG TPA: type II secretion system F family protein [Candidatus Hydrogenedens sp.]|nr:type II secretion system F family protein [Candidatus Hydrogenedens sp.]HOK08193.1 type II secretion system F family protein [Candidatus Hydrogenedens sp.]HOL20112.1 type II secretion system F family protein [Candidatus Hydrogenedens sp.]HPP58662.1 type II secretion system F family protein [Candidatus Hydrogenedens sp.]